MRYMLLINGDPSLFQAAGPAAMDAMMGEYMTFTQSIVESGELIAGDPLQGPETATTVRVRAGVRTVTDGPFAETTEVLGGYYIVNVADLDRALELATQIPGSRLGSVEVRAIQEMSEYPS